MTIACEPICMLHVLRCHQSIQCDIGSHQDCDCETTYHDCFHDNNGEDDIIRLLGGAANTVTVVGMASKP
jgi:hypothetical protein